LNTLQGGKFGHGFLSAGVTEALSPAIGAASSVGGAGGVVAGTVASAVVGGTVSELSGGKFGNGAQTGAFQFLFNQVVHDRQKAAQILKDEGVMPNGRAGLLPSSHEYSHLDLICNVSAKGCSVDAVFNGVRRFPAPGADGSIRVETGMITNVSIPGVVIGTDHVLHEVNQSAHRVFNFTLGDHVLNPGWVARTVFQVRNGVYVHTYGIGSGSNPFGVNSRQPVVNQVWGSNNNNIRKCVAAGTC